MTQLKTLDTGFLRAPDPDQHASMAMGAVAIVNGRPPDYGRIKALLAERIQLSGQSGCSADSDVTQHVQRVALPLPGDETELFGAIACALERPLDLTRPPWECWIIEGLKDNQWAILIKVHHSMADDNSAAHLLTRLCDDAEGDAFTSHVADNQISPLNTDVPTWADTLWQVPASMLKAAARVVGNAAETTATVMWPAVGPLTTRRRYRTVRIPRAAVERVSRKFGVTANDVALAAITEGFRAILVSRGEQPRGDSLRTLGPVFRYLPVEQDDPIQQLRAVHNRSKGTGQADQRFTGYSPFALWAKAFQILTRLPRQDIVTLATNAPGPRQRLRLMGQRMEQLLPIPPTALELSTGVAVLSYGDELVFGITADYHAAPQLEQLAAGIELGMTRLLALSADSVLLFDRGPKRRSRALPNSATRWHPSAVPGRVRP
ncbi:MAG: diacylglycerol O-acyltransferase / wax synthase [Mycobacterium sp.]|nr:diacylglycerol O-acyltransferase / wax synthase [Mycobacterium sp.]